MKIILFLFLLSIQLQAQNKATATPVYHPRNLDDFEKLLKEECYPNSKISILKSPFHLDENYDGFVLSYEEKFLSWFELNNGEIQLIKQFSKKQFNKNEKDAIIYFHEVIHDMYIDKYLVIKSVSTIEEREKIIKILLRTPGLSGGVTHDQYPKKGKYRVWIDNCGLGSDVKRF